MALGKTNRIEGKAYSLKLKLKDGERFLDVPVFDVQEKQGDEYVSVQKTTDVSGDLVKINTRVGEYEGSPIRNVTLVLKDKKKGEVYYTDFGLGSGLGRGLANSTLNLKGFTNVQIGLYGQKSKKDGKTYPAVSLRQGSSDETIKWAYDPKDGVIPPYREFKGKGGKLEKDWTDTEVFLFDAIKEFAKTIPADTADSEASPSVDDNQSVVDSDDSVPAETETLPAPTPAKVTPPKATVPAQKSPVSTPAKTAGKSAAPKTTTVAKPAQTPPPQENLDDSIPF